VHRLRALCQRLPVHPSRALWNGADKHAQKCDLCADTPFWNEKGGPGGKQACATVCAMKAISFTKDVPVQGADTGYNVDLGSTSKVWQGFGFNVG